MLIFHVPVNILVMSGHFPSGLNQYYSKLRILSALLKETTQCLQFCLFWCFTSQSTAMVMLGWSVHLLPHFFSWTSLTKLLTSTLCTYFHFWMTITLLEWAERRKLAVEIISWSISMKVWYRVGIELATPGSTVRHVSAVWYVTNCATQTGTVPPVSLALETLWSKLKTLYHSVTVLLYKVIP